MTTITSTEKVSAMNARTTLNISAKYMPWVICALGAVFYSYEYFLRIAPSVMTTDLMQHYDIDAGIFGSVTAFYYYAYVPMQLPVGILLDRYGPRRLLTLACMLCVVGAYLFVSTQSITVAACGRFLLGFGSAFAFVGVLKLVTMWLPKEHFAMFAGLASALGSLGAIVGDISLTWLLQQIGWKETAYASAYVGILLTFLLWFFIRDKDAGDYKDAVAGPNSIRDALSELSMILRNPQMWVVGMVGCLVYLPTTAFAELWSIPYLKQVHDFTYNDAAYANSMLFLGFTVGAPLVGMISDHFQRRRTPLLIGALGATTLMVILLYVPGLSRYSIYSILFFLGFMYGAQAIVFAIGREISPSDVPGTAMAVTNMLVMLGGILYQPLIGMLLDFKSRNEIIAQLHIYSVSDYQYALAAVPIGMFISAILVLFLKESAPGYKP